MAAKKQFIEEKFIKDNHLETVYSKAKEIEPDLWNMLVAIKKHYEEYSTYCEAIVQREVIPILRDSEANGIHSVRFRVKKLESLLSKVVKKKAFLSKEIQDEYEIEKYRGLNEKNYFKIITDISGIRILIRYREQWRQVHDWLWEKYYKGDEYYLHDFEKDYKNNEGKAFIVEKPKVYYRNQKDLMLYESIGKNIFDLRLSDEGYNSMHYLINADGKYIEIQLRTILDEAWSECTHDIVYKGNGKQQEELEYLSQCLSHQTTAAEAITNLMYEIVSKKGSIYRKANKSKNGKDIKNILQQSTKKQHISKVENRMKLLERQSDYEFDGNLDGLI